jgi:hypothetical protein
VSYSVNFQDDDDNNNTFTIRIDNHSGARVVNDVVKRADVNPSVSFIVNNQANNYNIQATGIPADTTFNVRVDDCRGDNNGDGRRRHRDHDRDRDRGAADQQYSRVEEEVIKDTIPDKGTLADTGGTPLVGVAFLALASVGLGLSILRLAIRRDP